MDDVILLQPVCDCEIKFLQIHDLSSKTSLRFHRMGPTQHTIVSNDTEPGTQKIKRKMLNSKDYG